MIGLLNGTIVDIREKEVLLLTSGGVGYTLSPAGSLLAKCQKGTLLTAEVLTIVRENEIALYGFGQSDERILFQKLITVSGIGPKTALQMVSIPSNEFMHAVEEGDVAFLTRIQDSGKKPLNDLLWNYAGNLISPAKKEIRLLIRHLLL